MRRKFFRWLLSPLFPLLYKIFEHDDPWESAPRQLPAKSFGLGSIRPFEWYFGGRSTISVSSLEEVCEWLLSTEYASDPDLFNETDFWQHPGTFEQLKKGDCEDHALWAWRKLRELAIPAKLVSGDRWTGESWGGHVWLLLPSEDPLIFECNAKSKAAMLLPLRDVKDRYRPHFAVDHALKTEYYTGYIQSWLEQERSKRHSRGAF